MIFLRDAVSVIENVDGLNGLAQGLANFLMNS